MHTSETEYHYEVYGLTLGSDRPIPGLDAESVPGRGAVDIRVTLGRIPRDLEHLLVHRGVPYHVAPGYNAGDPDHLVVRMVDGGSHYQFVYDDAVELVVDREASTVWCRWDSALTIEDAALYLLGPVIGFMLRLRGTTCLHASAVLVDDCALAITGASGAGKSTLAASFASAGYPVLTDDVLPLALVAQRILTRSGYGRLRLYPDTFKHMPGLPDDLPPIAPGWDKCFLNLASHDYVLHREQAPLRAVYVLDWTADAGQVASIAAIPGTAAIPLLAANTYRSDLLNSTMREREFYFLSALASAVPIKRLCPMDDLASVPALRQMLLADFKQEAGPEQALRAHQVAGDTRR